MRNPIYILLCISLVVLGLTSCGQKGDLYLPETVRTIETIETIETVQSVQSIEVQHP